MLAAFLWKGSTNVSQIDDSKSLNDNIFRFFLHQNFEWKEDFSINDAIKESQNETENPMGRYKKITYLNGKPIPMIN